MIVNIILLAIGMYALIRGADLLVDGSVSIAKKFKISTLVIGLTIVAIGTSMPEFIINVMGAIGGSSQLPLGNIIGSNIANTLLILGVSAIITPLVVKESTIYREIPYNLIATVALLILSMDLFLGKMDGAILLLILAAFGFYLYSLAMNSKSDFNDEDESLSHNHGTKKSLFLVAIGIIGLFIGGKFTVNGAVGIAQAFGLSEFLISATIIAFGTSLPELVTAVVAAKKGDVNLVVGNVVGSNILNIIMVLGTTMLITNIDVDPVILKDMYFMIAATLVFFIFVFLGRGKEGHAISRNEGVLLLLSYFSYIVYLIMRG